MTHAEEKSHEVAARKMLSANQGERYQEKKKKKNLPTFHIGLHRGEQ